jgi:hypothetical protein
MGNLSLYHQAMYRTKKHPKTFIGTLEQLDDIKYSQPQRPTTKGFKA